MALGSECAVKRIHELGKELESLPILCKEGKIELVPNEDLVEDPFVLPQILQYISYPSAKLTAPVNHRELFGIVQACKKLGVTNVLDNLSIFLEVPQTTRSLTRGRLMTKLRSIIR